MESLYGELDASVDFGSGYIAVVGPPSSGKSSLVLNYLVAREAAFEAARAVSHPGHTDPAPSCALHEGEPPAEPPVFLMEYWTAHSFSGDALSQMARRVEADAGERHGGKRRRRLGPHSSPLEFGHTVAQWLSSRPRRSELHLVVDDADTLGADAESVNTWLSGCLSSPAATDRCVCLWLVSQLPLRLPNCYRTHYVSPLRIAAVCAGVREAHRLHSAAALEDEDEDEDEGRVAERSVDGADAPAPTEFRLSTHTVNECVVAAAAYYATHQPMCASAVCKDSRLLLQRVHELLPALVLACGEVVEGPDGVRTLRVVPNAIHYSSVWSRNRGGAGVDSPGGDPLVSALTRTGYTAVLLAFAAFYCGAVPLRKQFEVFGASAEVRAAAPVTDTHAQSHKAAVLSAASQVITLPRLLYVYEAMLRMCVEHVDPLEFAPPDVAAHHVSGFQAWGLLTPVLGRRGREAYHCWIPVSTAVQLGKVLSLRLYDLIPA